MAGPVDLIPDGNVKRIVGIRDKRHLESAVILKVARNAKLKDSIWRSDDLLFRKRACCIIGLPDCKAARPYGDLLGLNLSSCGVEAEGGRQAG
jgi:hypothetical protein